MSSRNNKASAKRKRSSSKKEEESIGEAPSRDEVSTEVEYTLFSGWLDDGYPGDDEEVTEHEGFSLTLGGRNFDISIGDAVLMRSGDDEGSETTPAEYQDPSSKDSNKAGEKGMVARVERIWEKKSPAGSGECPYMFQARWFLRVRI